MTYATICDALVLTLCVAFLIRFGRLSALHPAVVYGAFHFYCVTARLWALLLGAAPYTGIRTLLTEAEIVRAAICADAALVAVTVTWVLVGRRWARKPGAVSARPIMLQKRLVVAVVAICFPVGLWGLVTFGDAASGSPALALGAWQTSAYFTILVTWPILSLLPLHYCFGWPVPLTLVTAALLLSTALNSARYSFVTAILFLAAVQVFRSRRRWFSPIILIVVAAVYVIAMPLKQIKTAILTGGGLDGARDTITSYYRNILANEDIEKNDIHFLDMCAAGMTAVDDHGKFFLGASLYPVLVNPIPRQLWPEKPRFNDYLVEISTPDRPLATTGATLMLIGDGYLNFGYLGVIIVPCIAAYYLGRLYFRAICYPHLSLARFGYVVIWSISVQIFRDGLESAIAYTFIFGMPLMFVVYGHLVSRFMTNHSAGLAASRVRVLRTRKAV